MNRLFSKLKDFGLIFHVDTMDEESIIVTSQALKKADNPVALFNFDDKTTVNSIKISNENEDMFLGALCPDNFDIIKMAIASGAHFIIVEKAGNEAITRCRNEGFDLIVAVQSEEELKRAFDSNAEAVAIDCGRSHWAKLTGMAQKMKMTLFLMGIPEDLPFEEMADNEQLCAYIVKGSFPGKEKSGSRHWEITIRANEIKSDLLGLRNSHLTLREDSPRSDEAAVFCALTAIPLFRGGERDLLTITVGDMDRTIAHLKWKEIYMDPFSAKMKGSKILETELYTEFLGWTVRLMGR